MPGVVSWGSPFVESASSVAATTVLTPSLPPSRTNGEWMFALTASTSTTATVACPGWQQIYNVAGASGKMACFALMITGSEVAPTITWTGLTTGSSGTPCTARTWNFGTGWLLSAGALVIDTLGTVSDQAASSTINAGGSSITTNSANTFLFAHGVRGSVALSAVVNAGGEPVPWIMGQADGSSTGADMFSFHSYGDGPTAGAIINDHTWTLTGGASVASSGLMVAMALEPAVDDVELNLYTRGS